MNEVGCQYIYDFKVLFRFSRSGYPILNVPFPPAFVIVVKKIEVFDLGGGISMFQDDSLIGRCFQRVCKRRFAVDRREGKFLGAVGKGDTY